MADENTVNDCSVVVGGLVFGGWERSEVSIGIEQIAGAFAMDVTFTWPGMGEPVPLREGLACTVRLGDDVVLAGYIDDFEPELEDKQAKVRLSGRHKAGDLVDCSAMNKPGQWFNVKLEKIVADIAAPFGITVTTEVDTGEKVERFALEDAEKAFAAIDRLARLRALLVVPTADGNLAITRASSTPSGVELVEGVNLKACSALHTWKERHSLVVMKGQSPGNDDSHGEAAAHQKAEATDAEIDRYRPLIVMSEHNTSTASLSDRAVWETRIRMGRGKRGQSKVVGWRTGQDGQEGPLWKPNTLVRVRSPFLNVDMDMLITRCRFIFDEKGKRTELEWCRPEAFQLIEGVGKSALNKRINDKTQREKKRKGDGYTPNWELNPPSPQSTQPRAKP